MKNGKLRLFLLINGKSGFTDYSNLNRKEIAESPQILVFEHWSSLHWYAPFDIHHFDPRVSHSNILLAQLAQQEWIQDLLEQEPQPLSKRAHMSHISLFLTFQWMILRLLGSSGLGQENVGTCNAFAKAEEPTVSIGNSHATGTFTNVTQGPLTLTHPSPCFLPNLKRGLTQHGKTPTGGWWWHDKSAPGGWLSHQWRWRRDYTASVVSRISFVTCHPPGFERK